MGHINCNHTCNNLQYLTNCFLQQLWATFRRKLEAMSNFQLKQIRLDYTPNIYHKQHLLGEGSRFIGITGAISPLVREIVNQQV